MVREQEQEQEQEQPEQVGGGGGWVVWGITSCCSLLVQKSKQQAAAHLQVLPVFGILVCVSVLQLLGLGP